MDSVLGDIKKIKHSNNAVVFIYNAIVAMF